MKQGLKWYLFAVVVLWMLSIPLDYYILQPVFIPLRLGITELLSLLIDGLKFESDSVGMYLLFPCCLVSAVPLAFIFQRLFRSGRPLEWMDLAARYFLILILLKYGWMKVIGTQFYLPEPNILYTNLGDLSGDIAYWSLMGSSPGYNLFLGGIEVLAGMLLLSSRLRFAGLLLSLGIFVQVVAVNFAFDISVKLFSVTLLVLTLLLLRKYRGNLQIIFGSANTVVKPVLESRVNKWIHAAILTFIFLEATFQSLSGGIWNDSHTERPEFHGAWKVEGNEAISAIYVHRKSYVILEDRSGQQLDYRVLNQSGGNFDLLDERRKTKVNLQIKKVDSTFVLVLNGRQSGVLRSLPYHSLPLLKSSFHWFSDEFH